MEGQGGSNRWNGTRKVCSSLRRDPTRECTTLLKGPIQRPADTRSGGTHLSKCESQSEVSGRVRRIWKGPHPDPKGESKHAELGMSEKVPSGPPESTIRISMETV